MRPRSRPKPASAGRPANGTTFGRSAPRTVIPDPADPRVPGTATVTPDTRRSDATTTRRRQERTTVAGAPSTDGLIYATYNILDGAWDPGRYADVLAVLHDLDADVIGLQEAKSWDADGFARVCDTAELLGMHALFAPSASHDCHLIIFYRTNRLRLTSWTADAACGKFHHTLQRATFVIRASGESLTVLNTHLDPFSPDGRAKEAAWLTGYAQAGTACVLLGDLNTIGAHDDEPNWDEFPRHLHSRHRIDLPGGGFGDADRRAIRKLHDAGFVDPYRRLNTLPPPTVGHWDDREPDLHRSDHTLVSSFLAPRIRDCGVVTTERAKRASDHLPAWIRVADRAPTPATGAAP
ncbi:endonuclease/exonuclease/phosphatase family protein [Embleya sp. MST-111070]|uniref:endonuclease/exonuclease/phosphatase family protein n=1 Tax=Embleya sp. MST-111070 TaxID=3398231 RepID=UPI003F73A251